MAHVLFELHVSHDVISSEQVMQLLSTRNVSEVHAEQVIDVACSLLAAQTVQLEMESEQRTQLRPLSFR